MYVIGLTGGISSGKSTVLRIFQGFGFKTINADEIARQLARKREILEKITEKFGREILTSKGRLRRKKLAALIFKSKEKREALNEIMHPEIIREIKSRIRKLRKETEGIIVVEIPLLFEARLEKLVDKILVVYVPEKVQMERLRRDNHLSIREAQQRIKSQIPLREKRRHADYVIRGDLPLSELKRQIKSICSSLAWQFTTCKTHSGCQ